MQEEQTEQVGEQVETAVMTEQMESVPDDSEQQPSDAVGGSQQESESEESQENRVPLSAVQAERRRRQEADAAAERARIELDFYKEQFAKASQQQPPAEEAEDPSLYEGATRADLNKYSAQTKGEILQEVEERLWTKANPEKTQYVNDNLANFLKQRPNLASAIKESTNRYEEAYTLMTALSPKERKQMQKAGAPSRPAANSPAAVPKAAAMNQAVDVMQMSDQEYFEWRQAQKRRR